MQLYKFQAAVTVDGVPFKSGDVVPENKIPAGYLSSCLRVGHCVPHSQAKEEPKGEPEGSGKKK